MKALGVFAVACAIAYSLVLLYGTSVPGGGTLTLSFAVVAMFFPILGIVARALRAVLCAQTSQSCDMGNPIDYVGNRRSH